MRKFLVFSSICFILISCQKDEIDLSNVSITKISFKRSLNSTLNNDLTLDFDGASTFTASVPLEVNINQLVATYEFEGGSIEVNGVSQTNGVTSNDFGKEVVVSVFNEDLSGSKDYKVRISYHTGLPIVYIETNGQEVVSKDDYIIAETSVYGGLFLDDIVPTNVGIRGRGNSSWMGGEVPKKSYQIKFEDKKEVLGMPGDRRWVLLAEFWDRSMVRNKISYDMGLMSRFDYSPTGEFVEVIFNGDSHGTYLLAQKVEESKSRVNIGDNGYLIEMDQRHRIDGDDVYFEPPTFRNKMAEKFWWTDTIFNIKEPSIEFGSEEYNYIMDHINSFESVLFGSDFSDPNLGYRPYIDIDSFVDWYLINEIGKTVDAYGYASVFFHHEPGGKIKMGPIWDFDLSYGNADYANSYPNNAFSPEGNTISGHPWFERLLQDPYFRDKVNERYAFFYNNKEMFLEKIDSYVHLIDASQRQNYEIWQTLGTGMWNNSSAVFDSYEEEINYLKTWLDARMNWLRGHYN